MTPHEDRRKPDRRRADGRIVHTQVDRIRDSQAARTYQRELFDTIRGKRRAGHPSYDVGSLERDHDFLVAVTGEVLVRTANRDAAAAVLGPAGFDTGTALPGLDGRVTRFRKQAASVGATNLLARGLRRDGVAASVNYVVPLGYVAKGEGGFEPTQLASPYAGPGAAPAGGVRVGIVDTGITPEARTDGWFANMDRTPQNTDPLYAPPGTNLLDFSAGHGTFAAGVIQQVAPDADIRMYRAIGSDGIGSELDIAEALLRAADDGAQVVNLSLGTETDQDSEPVGLEVALELLCERHPDVLLVAAAGNSGSTAPTWPAAFRSVVAVASLTADGRPSTWSNHGSWVDCSTVGEGVVSTYVPGQESEEVDKEQADLFGPDSWALGTGTSFATPQVVGAIAELMAGPPGLSARDALRRLLDPANGAFKVPGYGMGLRILPGTASS